MPSTAVALVEFFHNISYATSARGVGRPGARPAPGSPASRPTPPESP